MMTLTIPYNQKDVGHCYERLKQTLPVYQEGISAIRLVMESNKPFSARLQKVVKANAAVLKSAQTQASPHSWNEDDIYLCCLYDMLEAMYAAESARIATGPGSADEKRKQLAALASSIDKLPFGSPQFREGIRPRLEKAVSNHLEGKE